MPIENELDHHALHVEAVGQAAMDFDQASADPTEIKMLKSMQVGGFVEDENGKPLAHATVRISLSSQAAAQLMPLRTQVTAVAHTNESGQWLAAPLPWADQVELQISPRITASSP